MTESLDSWFQREIISLEPMLLGYLRRVWPRREDIDDLMQETYARIYQAALTSRPSAPRAFLFATARHLMTDRVRRERIISIQAIGDLDALNVLVDELSAEHRANAHQELNRLAKAFDALPPRCREVVWLRRVEELTQRQVAERLGITVKTVEAHLARGMQLLGEHLLEAPAETIAHRAKEQTESDDVERKP